MDKPIKPTETLAESFGGIKENFTEEKIEDGYKPDFPDILGGANLNYLLDTLGKKFKYNDSISDYISNIPIESVPYVDNNNKLIYTNDVSFKSKDETITGVKTFKAIPSVPTATKGTKNLKVANTEFVQNAISNLASKDEIPTDYATKIELNKKQDTLTAGNNIEIVDNVISVVGNGHDLFDIVQKDRILSYEETEGYELLGNYVYKEALAGSRYGYPDFYNKVIEEYNEATETKTVEVYESSNVNVFGSLINTNGVIRGFGEDNYAQVPVLVSGMGAFELQIKFRLTNNAVINPLISTSVIYDGLMLRINADGVLTAYISSNGTSWNVMNGIKGTHVYQKDVDYWVKVKYNGSGYFVLSYSVDGKNFTTDIEGGTSGSLMYSATTLYNLGKDYTTNILKGSIDLKECYLEQARSIDENWVGANLSEFSYRQHSNGHKFFDIADKEAVDKFYNANGMAWFYGVDTANERVMLPRNDWYFMNGSADEVGNNIEAGLPNIEGTASTTDSGNVYKNTSIFSGAFRATYNENISANGYTATDSKSYYDNLVFDASLSNSIYGNSETVQPASVSVLAYMVVGNVKTTQGYSEVVAQGKEILEQVNAGIETRANLDLGNVTQSSGLRRLIEVSDSSLMPSWYKVFEEVNPQTGEVKKWCEQGGLSTTKTATSVIDLIKSYKDKNSYSVDITWTYTASNDNYGAIVDITSNNSFTIYRSGTGAQKLSNFWTAKGYMN